MEHFKCVLASLRKVNLKFNSNKLPFFSKAWDKAKKKVTQKFHGLPQRTRHFQNLIELIQFYFFK